MSSLKLLLLLSLVGLSLACTGGGGPITPVDPFIGTVDPFEVTGGDDACSAAVADNSKTLDKGSTGYGDGGPVEKKDKLKFNANNPGQGCWKNHEAPQDDIDYSIVNGDGLQDCPFGDLAKGKKFLVAYSPEAQPGKTAQFHSCSILCSEGPVKVKVDGAANDADLEVCTADSFTDGQLKNCKKAKFGQPVQIADGKNTIYDVVLKSSKFKENGFVAVNKIDVDFKPCSDAEGGGGDDICAAACDFSGQSTCSWKTDPENQAATEFKAYETKTIVGNLDSGVNARLDGNPSAAYPIVSDTEFLATPQNPGDLNVASVDVPEVKDDSYELTTDVYEACDGDAAKVCFDSISNCPADFFNLGVTAADRQWQMKKVKVPKGTKKIYLVGDNSQGQRFCAAGFKNINFVKGGSSEPVCGGEKQPDDN